MREPHHRKQQAHAGNHRERQAVDARPVLPLRRQALDQDGDEDQVVDAEDNLEQRQRQKR
jgi:hypothetical protein